MFSQQRDHVINFNTRKQCVKWQTNNAIQRPYYLALCMCVYVYKLCVCREVGVQSLWSSLSAHIFFSSVQIKWTVFDEEAIISHENKSQISDK